MKEISKQKNVNKEETQITSKSATVTVKITPDTKKILDDLSQKTGVKLFRILDAAVTFYADNVNHKKQLKNTKKYFTCQ